MTIPQTHDAYALELQDQTPSCHRSHQGDKAPQHSLGGPAAMSSPSSDISRSCGPFALAPDVALAYSVSSVSGAFIGGAVIVIVTGAVRWPAFTWLNLRLVVSSSSKTLCEALSSLPHHPHGRNMLLYHWAKGSYLLRIDPLSHPTGNVVEDQPPPSAQRSLFELGRPQCIHRRKNHATTGRVQPLDVVGHVEVAPNGQPAFPEN